MIKRIKFGMREWRDSLLPFVKSIRFKFEFTGFFRQHNIQ